MIGDGAYSVLNYAIISTREVIQQSMEALPISLVQPLAPNLMNKGIKITQIYTTLIK